MAFGNAVTEFSQVSIGSVGYTIKVDLTGLRMFRLMFVQAQASASSTPSPTSKEETLEIIQSYLDNTLAPNLAFNYGYGEATIFLKTSAFPYVQDTRIGLFGLRNPIAMVNDSDKADFSDKDLELFVNYVLRHAYNLKKIPVSGNIERRIKQLEDEILS